ncbi:hypothetical protein [Azospirillum canadense]|uniref:hypothetical protein n=1 Tax=Azospirillum canadense TaxID=403962 RepID=UPI0022276A90|nr:hypothetical protein [Azospirillum canadense]MCW2240661.1 hypothetical protein [Azospirillum canadense]
MACVSWARAFLVTAALSVAACAYRDTTPSQQSMEGVQISDVSASDVDFEFIDLRMDRQAAPNALNVVRRDMASVLSASPASGGKKYKFLVEVNEFRTYFAAPQWHSVISLRVKMLNPQAELLGVVEPAAHAFRWNTWGLGSAEDAEREARRATATEFVKLASPLLKKV